ncbi:ATP-binding protein [Candidatus Dependentiae bacterium]|nr:ATP-binding protein [Candidatus Dependentiae bacterium]
MNKKALSALLVGALLTSPFSFAEGWLDYCGNYVSKVCKPLFSGLNYDQLLVSAEDEWDTAPTSTSCVDRKAQETGNSSTVIGYCQSLVSSGYGKLPAFSDVKSSVGASIRSRFPTSSKAVAQTFAYKPTTNKEPEGLQVLVEVPSLIKPISESGDSSNGKEGKGITHLLQQKAGAVGSFCYSLWPAKLGPRYYIKEFTKLAVRTAGEEVKDSLVKPVINDLKGIEAKLEDKIDEKYEKVKEDLKEANQKFKENYLYVTGAFVACGVSVLALKYLWNKVSEYVNMPVLEHVKITPVIADTVNSALEIGFENMVFKNDLKTRLRDLLVSTKALSSKKADNSGDTMLFSNVLLQGPVGLGKRSFVQELASFADMDFYEIKSSSLVNFKDNQASQALGNFFDEIEQGFRAAVVYIDNASILFSKCGITNITDIGRMIQAFVEKTERRSAKFMLVLGVQERPISETDMFSVIDEIIEFKLPTERERAKLLCLYRDKLLLTAKDVTKSFAEQVGKLLDAESIQDLAHKLENFSSADIASLVKEIKTNALEVYNGVLSKELIDQIVARKTLKCLPLKVVDKGAFSRLRQNSSSALVRRASNEWLG